MAIRGPLTPQRVASASSAATSPAAAAVASPPTQSEGPWRRVWCVLQDSALAFFEHERAAANITAEPIATYEWLHFRSLRLAPSTSAARSSPSGSSFASADFELTSQTVGTFPSGQTHPRSEPYGCANSCGSPRGGRSTCYSSS